MIKKSIKILALFSIISLTSCNRDTEGSISEISPIGIDSVSIPNDTMSVYNSQVIKTYSTYREGCEGFYGYDYSVNDLTREITAFRYKTESTCGIPFVASSQINFIPQKSGIYTLKFKGVNDAWIEKTIIVR